MQYIKFAFNPFIAKIPLSLLKIGWYNLNIAHYSLTVYLKVRNTSETSLVLFFNDIIFLVKFHIKFCSALCLEHVHWPVWLKLFCINIYTFSKRLESNMYSVKLFNCSEFKEHIYDHD